MERQSAVDSSEFCGTGRVMSDQGTAERMREPGEAVRMMVKEPRQSRQFNGPRWSDGG